MCWRNSSRSIIWTSEDTTYAERFISNRKYSRNLPNTNVCELQYRFALTSAAPSMIFSAFTVCTFFPLLPPFLRKELSCSSKKVYMGHHSYYADMFYSLNISYWSTFKALPTCMLRRRNAGDIYCTLPLPAYGLHVFSSMVEGCKKAEFLTQNYWLFSQVTPPPPFNVNSILHNLPLHIPMKNPQLIQSQFSFLWAWN